MAGRDHVGFWCVCCLHSHARELPQERSALMSTQDRVHLCRHVDGRAYLEQSSSVTGSAWAGMVRMQWPERMSHNRTDSSKLPLICSQMGGDWRAQRVRSKQVRLRVRGTMRR